MAKRTPHQRQRRQLEGLDLNRDDALDGLPLVEAAMKAYEADREDIYQQGRLEAANLATRIFGKSRYELVDMRFDEIAPIVTVDDFAFAYAVVENRPCFTLIHTCENGHDSRVWPAFPNLIGLGAVLGKAELHDCPTCKEEEHKEQQELEARRLKSGILVPGEA